MQAVRLYLAFLKDEDGHACIDGMTVTSIKANLASEGLPTSPTHLQKIFLDVYSEFGLNEKEAVADLAAYKSYLSSERINRLQHNREAHAKFYGRKNF